MISVATGRVTATGNGVTTTFSVTFPFFEIEVYVNGVLKSAPGDYTITQTNPGETGSVVFGSAPANAAAIVIVGKTDATQTVDLANNQGFDADATEKQLDRFARALQDIQLQLTYVIRAPLYKAAVSALDFAANPSTVLISNPDGEPELVEADDEDSPFYDILIAAVATATADAEAAAAAAASSASTATTQASNAATSAGTATTQAGIATTQAGNAATSAAAALASEVSAAASAAKLQGTSTSSVAVGTGSKAFTTQSGKFFNVGYWLLIVDSADPANYMHGYVTAYSGTSLTVEVTNIGGSGTIASWNIFVAGTRGATGATGPAGTLDFTALSDEAIAVGDFLVFGDISDSTSSKRVTASDFLKLINLLTEDTAPLAADFIVTYDTSASAPKKVAFNRVGAGRQTIWIPASAMTPRITNGAAPGLVEMTTNKNMFKTLDFDTTTQEFAQFLIHMPKSWDLGTVTFQPVMSHASGSGNIVWGLAGVALSDDDAGDVAFGTPQTSDKTIGTANDIYIGPESSAITIAGSPAAGDAVMFQVNRTVASDNLGVDARLHGIRLFYTTNANTDV